MPGADRTRTTLHFFSTSAFRQLAQLPCPPKSVGFALSADGRSLARKSGDRYMEIRAVAGVSTPICFSPKGRSHQRVNVMLGQSALVIYVGEFIHLYTLGQAHTGNHTRTRGRLMLSRPGVRHPLVSSCIRTSRSRPDHLGSEAISGNLHDLRSLRPRGLHRPGVDS